MKPLSTPQFTSENPARLEFQVRFTRRSKGRRRIRRAKQPEKSSAPDEPVARPVQCHAGPFPKITRLLVLGHHFGKLVREGKAKDYVEIARLSGLSRARVTQIVNLTLLAPEIQEGILCLDGNAKRMQRFERDLRIVVTQADWSEQDRLLHKLDSR